MTKAKQLAAKLREGKTLNFCDSSLCWEGGVFKETHMSLSVDGHYFLTSKVSWLQVKSWLKQGKYH